MLASELIEILQSKINAYGDKQVHVISESQEAATWVDLVDARTLPNTIEKVFGIGGGE